MAGILTKLYDAVVWLAAWAGLEGLGERECSSWGTYFIADETRIENPSDGIWTVEGILKVALSEYESGDRPYDGSFTELQVLVVADGDVVGREWIGEVRIDDDGAETARCIDSLFSIPFSITVDRPPTRVAADCAEFPEMRDHAAADVREYSYTGDGRDRTGSMGDEAWENRERPYHDRSLG